MYVVLLAITLLIVAWWWTVVLLPMATVRLLLDLLLHFMDDFAEESHLDCLAKEYVIKCEEFWRN
jgi:hypothetical protein